MNEQEIAHVAKVPEEWNPLGEKANSIEGLEGYRYDAIDIIAGSSILSKTQNIKDSIEKVLTQAFSIDLNEDQLSKAAIKIQATLSSIKW
jgi:hypothetical protein